MMTQSIICNNSLMNGAHRPQYTTLSYCNNNNNYCNQSNINNGYFYYNTTTNNTINVNNRNKNYWRVITFRAIPTPCMEYVRYSADAIQANNNGSNAESAAPNPNKGHYHKIITEYQKFGKLSPWELTEFRRSCTVVLENVRMCTTDFELRSILNWFGEVHKVRVTRPKGLEHDPTAFFKCFALYSTKESADFCKRYLNGAEFHDLRLIVNPPRIATVSSHESDYDEEHNRACTFGTNGPYDICDEVCRLMERIGIWDNSLDMERANAKEDDENDDDYNNNYIHISMVDWNMSNYNYNDHSTRHTVNANNNNNNNNNTRNVYTHNPYRQ